MEDDDDFWVTHTALTPEEDQDFAGCGRILAWAIAALIVAALLAVCL